MKKTEHLLTMIHAHRDSIATDSNFPPKLRGKELVISNTFNPKLLNLNKSSLHEYATSTTPDYNIKLETLPRNMFKSKTGDRPLNTQKVFLTSKERLISLYNYSEPSPENSRSIFGKEETTN